MARIFALLILVAAVTGAAAGERFPILQPDQMSANQKKLLEALLAGPRGGGNASPEAVQKMLRGGPFNAWMRSPISVTDCKTSANTFATEPRCRCASTSSRC
jgi:hypothetical protein